MMARAHAPSAPTQAFNGVRVFSATMHRQRAELGETVERWLAKHPEVRVADFVVTQSSDASFHCISICVFYRDLSFPSSPRSELGAGS
jgi:hypothetical protein